MKIKFVIAALLILIIGVSAMRIRDLMQEGLAPLEEVVTPVEVEVAMSVNYTEKLVYQGPVSPDRVYQAGFKSTARLKSFNGKVGEMLEKGELLAALEVEDLNLALDAAREQSKAASAEYQRAVKGARPEDIRLAMLSLEKTKEALAYLQDRVADLDTLYKEGIVAKSELDGAMLELDMATRDMELAEAAYAKAVNGTEQELINAAKAQLEMARTNEEASMSLIEDAAYRMPEDGVILQRFYQEGELVPAGYPVALFRSVTQNVIIGVSRRDLEQVYIGQDVEVEVYGKSYEGEVFRIAEIPDETHFLYEVEVDFDASGLKTGEIVSCSLITGTNEGVTVPISAVMNDGIDYVYLAVEGKAMLQKVVIIKVLEGEVLVEGIEEGDLVIVSNLNRIHEQSNIRLEE